VPQVSFSLHPTLNSQDSTPLTMPARSEFTVQPETCSCWVPHSTGAPGIRPNQRSREASRENTGAFDITAGAPKSTWQGRSSVAAKSTNKSEHVNASMRSRALSDITNVGTSQAAHVDKGKPPKQPQHPLKPLAPVVPGLPAVGSLDELRSYDPEMLDSDAQSVQVYAPDILNALFCQETAGRPNYMDTQTDISAKMRSILIDWLIEVHMKYRLSQESLHLTVNLIDRYLAIAPVMRKRLQLIGVTAMFIASKFEDIKPPELHEMVYITDSAYKKEDILLMECTMLTSLGFKVVVPTAAHFFEPLQKANGCDSMHREVALYLLEMGLLDLRMLKYTPSHVVAAVLLLSNELLQSQPVWPETMVQQTRHARESLQACVDELRLFLEADQAGGQMQAVHKKFSSAQRHGVAKMKF